MAANVRAGSQKEHGFRKNVRISPEPMHHAVRTLETEPSNQNTP